MDIHDCIQFANTKPLCHLATAEGDQPRVRTLGFWFADETGFYFQTAGFKALYHQLTLNPNVEVCFYHHEQPMGTMMRIAGKIEFVDDRKLKEKVMQDRPFLKNFGLSAESAGLILFRMAHGKAYFWRVENNLKPKEIIEF